MNLLLGVKSGIVLAVLVALLSVGCNGAAGNCSRTKYWDEKEMRQAYHDDWVKVFEVDKDGNPTKGKIVYRRISDLEKYCWQMRIKY